MRILIVGGTIFVGRNVVEVLLEAGHEVTLLHRGRHPSPFVDQLEELTADRRDGEALARVLRDRRFDACIDTCGYEPDEVALLLNTLEGVTERYLFCSTCSVYDYDRLAQMPLLEDAPLVETPPESDHPHAAYGYNKVRCEAEALGRAGFATTVIRPSYILGPHEPYYREPYFFERAEAGRPLPLPGGGYNVHAYGDARDLAAAFCLAITAESTYGKAYHLSGEAVTLRHLTLECLRAAVAAEPTALVRPIPFGRLEAAYERDWGGDGPPPPFPFAWDRTLILDQSAIERDLDWRPRYSLRQTLRDTHAWWVSVGRPNVPGDWRLDELLLADEA